MVIKLFFLINIRIYIFKDVWFFKVIRMIVVIFSGVVFSILYVLLFWSIIAIFRGRYECYLFCIDGDIEV